jgi:ceramide glucosyltransferase
MRALSTLTQYLFLVPIAAGSIYALLCLLAVRRFLRQNRGASVHCVSVWPPVTILKPVCGLEKDLESNLRTACGQDYPEFQVVLAVEDAGDPALPILEKIRQDYPDKVSVAVSPYRAGRNGKINNLLGGLTRARHDILVVSDTDVRLRPDYLKAIVGPLADPETGFACTIYKAAAAGRWFEKLALLTLNADFTPSAVFAYVSGASKFCLGASVALPRRSLAEIGGLEALADYMAEDNELGRRLWMSGKRMVLVPYLVDVLVSLRNLSQWWNFQVSWDQKTRSAQPAGFFATVVIRAVPFALLFAALRLGDTPGLAVLAGALAVRLGTAAGILDGFGDREGLRSLALLPLRDVAGLVSWACALTKKTLTWRSSKLTLGRHGRLKKREIPL